MLTVIWYKWFLTGSLAGSGVRCELTGDATLQRQYADRLNRLHPGTRLTGCDILTGSKWYAYNVQCFEVTP